VSRRAIVWFRRDLRVADHPALLAALDEADEIVPVWVLDRRLLLGRGTGPNRRAFLHGALESLDAALRERGARLAVPEGDPVKVIPELAAGLGAERVHHLREYTPWAVARDKAVARALEDQGAALVAHPGMYLLDDFDEITTGSGDPFKVYSPFARAVRDAGWSDPVPAPGEIPAPGRVPGGTGVPPLSRFEAGGAVGTFPPDPDKALERLRWFARTQAEGYATERDHPAVDATSKLSPYLRLGLISPRQAAAAMPGGRGKGPTGPSHTGSKHRPMLGARTFVDELIWRDFYAYVLYHRPDSAWSDWREDFKALKWESDPDGLAAWKEGRTGFPLVDAGMRQLVATGWMHNRIRMITASFLCKDLLIDWREGAAFFLRHLVDGDLASNNGGWQWAASTGTDPQPYFRVFNPTRQAERFDPEGSYIRQWVPELAKVEGGAIFEPWKLSESDQKAAGVRVGTDYPAPIVAHDEARKRALARFEEIRRAR
jgi:deoxyribodipyrimidine photo-lyase